MPKTKRKFILITPEDSDAGDVSYFVTSRSNNTKTGDVPTIWIGNSKQQVARSCSEAQCPLLPNHKGGSFVPGKGKHGCYAWNGTVQMGMISMWKKASTQPWRYELENALRESSLNARYVRLSAIGDPISLTDEQRKEIINGIAKHNEEYRSSTTSLRVLGYTHGWKQEGASEAWSDLLMASCHSVEDADEAFELGFRPALEMSFAEDPGRVVTTPKGNKLMVCPHLLSEELKPKMVKDCNACGWCAIQGNEKFKFGIVFPNHK